MFNLLTFSHCLLLLLSIFLSIRISTNELVHQTKKPKYCGFSLKHQSLLWIFRIDFLMVDLFQLLESKGLLRAFSKKRKKEKKPFPSPQFELSIVWRSASFIVQLSHPYVTTRKTIGLTILTFVSKVISCFWIRCLDWSSLFFQGVTVFEFHDWNHHPQWFWSPPKVCHWFHFPHLLELSNGAKCHDLSFLNVEFSASFHSQFHPH